MRRGRGQPIKWMLACLLLLSAPASASVPYDKFCDQDGKITNDREVLAMLARPGELDAIYEDALRGDVRATRFLRTLEVTFEESARVVAENVSSPECAAAPFLPKCRADWRILVPLRGQGRGAARLLEVTQDAYEQRLRELAPQRRLNEAALTMLMTVGPLLAKRPAAKSAGAAEARPTAPAPAAAKVTTPYGPAVQADTPRSSTRIEAANKLPWRSWGEYEKVTAGGREYAKIGDRLYTRHAVDRLQPSGLGTPAGGGPGPGRSISPTFVEDVIRNGATQSQVVNGVERIIHTSGTVQVVTEQGGKVVITVNPFSGGP